MAASSTRSRSNGRKEEDAEKSRPVFSRRAWTGTASVEVAIFDKMVTGDAGEFRVFNVVVKRSWKDGEKFESSNSLRPEDLLPMAAFLHEAFLWIANENAKR